MRVQVIRNELREGNASSVERRRWIGILAALGTCDFVVISLYQIGVIRHLPDPPGRVFDSDKVNASTKAYALGVPDGTLALCQYAATFVLLSAGGSKRSGRHPVFDVLLGGTVLAGALSAVHYLYDMARNQRRICPYCVVGAAVNLAMLSLVAPLALASSRRLWSRPGSRP